MKYRIVREVDGWHKVEVKHAWWPWWVYCSRQSYMTVEEARTAINRIINRVVEYVEAK